jgi:hypothetical protein
MSGIIIMMEEIKIEIHLKWCLEISTKSLWKDVLCVALKPLIIDAT